MSQRTLQNVHGLTTRDVFVTLRNQVVFLYELAVVMELDPHPVKSIYENVLPCLPSIEDQT